jgi:four helix bundle protein
MSVVAESREEMYRQSGNPAIGPDRSDFRRIAVWQEAQSFARDVAAPVATLPRSRAADVIGNQLMRSAGSIAANIAEGYGRFSQPAYRHHLSIARGSASIESESWLDLLVQAGYLTAESAEPLIAKCSTVQRMISARMKALGEATATYAREDGPIYDARRDESLNSGDEDQS